MKKYFLACMLFVLWCQSAWTQDKRPHIVFFLIDDLGYADCGFNGGKDISTPAIDRLATEGSILKNMYVQPVCSPTRAALLTGRYPTRTGVYSIIRPGAQWGLPLKERTLADALREAGYKTAVVGKWHLGECSTSYQPNARGFDHQYGHFFGSIDYFTHARDNQMDWYRNSVPLKEDGYSTHLIAQEASSIIENHEKTKPLFLYIPFNGVHSPFQVPEHYTRPYQALEGNRKKLAGMLAAVDEAIAQITASLEKSGMRKNTLIIFSSDNGGPPPGNNAPLRDFKATVYEGGIRAAAFANWPGHVPSGKTVSANMHAIDWYPTLVGLAGGSTSQPLPIDGKDIWPTITQGKASPHKEILSVSTSGPSLAAIRMGEWKLIVAGANEPDGAPIQKQRKKYEAISLFNLEKDPGESTNLAAMYPKKVAAMRAQLLDMMKDAVAPGGK